MDNQGLIHALQRGLIIIFHFIVVGLEMSHNYDGWVEDQIDAVRNIMTS